MNTRDLDYFIKLVELKNFSQVAQAFHVTQPTITFALKRLETQYNQTLVSRDHSRQQLIVTEAGQKLYQHALVITHELALIEAELTAPETITFGLPPIIGNYYFPTIVQTLADTGVMSQLTTKEAGSAALLASLQSGEIDVALLGSSGPLVSPDLHVTRLASFPFTLVMSPDYHLAKSKGVRLEAVGQTPFILLNEGFVHEKAFDWFAATESVSPNILYRTSDVSLVKRMVQQHLGLGFLAELAVTPEDHLVTVPLIEPNQPHFEISVVYRQNQVLSPVAQNLVTHLEHLTQGG
ncbi:LysR family transcriptional regulator [Lacticaseibacillus brantae]|uniref:Malolactic fermentation system transcription activator n=1 Tax=Lacticaseibacillus brantae DSM 23927 TaxID=1423727 RepID=A0A0R2B6N8_9LACO|nr:LysR family transcriptional regulator [Lacticaseibacillus brantae]KRM71945.1 malolactic fermentation system transcription activator [Lacticaseibacillus brantae DSM 23927]